MLRQRLECLKTITKGSSRRQRKVREMVTIKPSTVKGGKGSQSTKAVWKKVPSSFYVDVPKLDTDGNVQTTSNGPVYTRLYGEVTPAITLRTKRNGKSTCSNNKLNQSRKLVRRPRKQRRLRRKRRRGSLRKLREINQLHLVSTPKNALSANALVLLVYIVQNATPLPPCYALVLQN